MMAGLIGVIAPPKDTIASRLVHAGRAAGRTKTNIHRELPHRDIWICAVENDSSRLVLVEAQMNHAAQKIPRLRVALAYCKGNLMGQKVSRSSIVLRAVSEIGIQIACGGVADTQHQRVLRR